MMEGLVQGVRYGSSSERMYFRLPYEGAYATASGTPTVAIYNPSGTVVLAATNLTTTAAPIYTYDLNASATATYPLGVDYRAQLSWTHAVTSKTILTQVFFDVVKQPFNNPVIGTTDVDEVHPTWAGKRPTGWTDWSIPIQWAHVRVVSELRQRRTDLGKPLYPHQIIDTSQLFLAEMAYTEREIARNLRLSDEERGEIFARAENALNLIVYHDYDDDLVKEEDEEESSSIMLRR